jgi:hypothetical protein
MVFNLNIISDLSFKIIKYHSFSLSKKKKKVAACFFHNLPIYLAASIRNW